MITNLAYLDFDEQTKQMRLASIHPGIDVETVKESTGFELIIPENVQETNPPTVKEILNNIIQKELDKQIKFPKLLI